MASANQFTPNVTRAAAVADQNTDIELKQPDLQYIRHALSAVGLRWIASGVKDIFLASAAVDHILQRCGEIDESKQKKLLQLAKNLETKLPGAASVVKEVAEQVSIKGVNKAAVLTEAFSLTRAAEQTKAAENPEKARLSATLKSGAPKTGKRDSGGQAVRYLIGAFFANPRFLRLLNRPLLERALAHLEAHPEMLLSFDKAASVAPFAAVKHVEDFKVVVDWKGAEQPWATLEPLVSVIAERLEGVPTDDDRRYTHARLLSLLLPPLFVKAANIGEAVELLERKLPGLVCVASGQQEDYPPMKKPKGLGKLEYDACRGFDVRAMDEGAILILRHNRDSHLVDAGVAKSEEAAIAAFRPAVITKEAG